MSKKYGYARCSTNESRQDIHRQIKELKAAGAGKKRNGKRQSQWEANRQTAQHKGGYSRRILEALSGFCGRKDECKRVGKGLRGKQTYGV